MVEEGILTENCPICGMENEAIFSEIGMFLDKQVKIYCVCDKYGKQKKLDWITFIKILKNKDTMSHILDTVKISRLKDLLGFGNIDFELNNFDLDFDIVFLKAMESTGPFYAVFDKVETHKKANELGYICTDVIEQLEKRKLFKSAKNVLDLKVAYHGWAEEIKED